MIFCWTHLKKIMLGGVLFLAACSSSPDNRYYLLQPAPPVSDSDAQTTTMSKLTISVPGYLDRPQIVTQEGDGEVDILEFDRWAEPVDSMIKRVLIADIAASRASPPVTAAPINAVVTIDDFIIQDDGVSLKAHWSLAVQNPHAKIGVPAVVHSFNDRRSVAATDLTASIAAMNELLNELARRIATQPDVPLRQNISS